MTMDRLTLETGRIQLVVDESPFRTLAGAESGDRSDAGQQNQRQHDGVFDRRRCGIILKEVTDVIHRGPFDESDNGTVGPNS